MSGRSGSRQLDLLAVDAAYPNPVCPEDQRRAVHQSWEFGEIVLLEVDDRLAAGVPGRSFDANLACDAISRVAKSVAATPGSFSVTLRV